MTTAVFLQWNGTNGGAENYTRNLARVLRRDHAVDARLLFLNDGGSIEATARQQGIPTLSLGYRSGLQPLERPEPLRTALKSARPTSIVLVAYGTAHLCLRAAGISAPIVVVQHNGEALRPWSWLRSRHVAMERVMRLVMASRTQSEVAVSEYMGGRQLRVRHARSLLVIPNGVDTDVFLPNEERPCASATATLRVAAAGRLVPEKGFQLALQAMRSLVDRRVRVRLDIAGGGPQRQQLATMITDLGLESHVRLVGATSDMASFWRLHDVAVVPSTSHSAESFGMVAVEAMASGLPVIATCVGALPSLFDDGEVGLLVRPDSATALATALESYATRRDLLIAHGVAARDSAVRRFSLDASANRFATLLAGFCGRDT